MILIFVIIYVEFLHPSNDQLDKKEYNQHTIESSFDFMKRRN